LHHCRRRKLLALNPNNHRYHEGLQASLGLAPAADGSWSAQQRQRLGEVYGALAQQFPSAGAVKRLPLDFKAREKGFARKAFVAAASMRRHMRGCPWSACWASNELGMPPGIRGPLKG
jgi:hypothetical protein